MPMRPVVTTSICKGLIPSGSAIAINVLIGLLGPSHFFDQIIIRSELIAKQYMVV